MLASHKVLLTHELLVAIFRQLSTGMVHPDDKPGDVQDRIELRRTLARGAQVCQSFSEPALNVLWCAMDNMIPLLRLLPAFGQHQSSYMLTGDITNDDWFRLKAYASRIRGLCLYPGTTIHHSVWTTLLARCGGIPLLPKLRVLDVDRMPVHEVTSFIVVLSPSLNELYLSFQNQGPEPPNRQLLHSVAAMTLASITTVSPELKIFYMDEHFPLTSFHLQPLTRLTRLRELKLCDPDTAVDASVVRILSTMEDLRILYIEDLRIDGVPLQFNSGFRSIETLYAHAVPEDITALLRAGRLPVIKHLDVVMHLADGQLPATYLTLMVASLPPTLHNFRLGFCDGSATIPPSCQLSEILQLLSPLKGLSDITLDSGTRDIRVSDVDIRTIADQWPRIQKFMLDEHHSQPRSLEGPQPTYAALAEVATRCPQMISFTLPCLDAGTLPELQKIPVVRHPLQFLTFRYIIGGSDPKDVAVVLNRLFPSFDLHYEQGAQEVWRRERTQLWYLFLDAVQELRKGTAPTSVPMDTT